MTSRLTKPSAQVLDAELARVGAALEKGVAYQGLSAFYQTLCATLPIRNNPELAARRHPLEGNSAEVVFAPLVGEPLAVIDRRYGRLVVGEKDFTARRW